MPIFVNLNDGVACGAVQLLYVGAVNTGICQGGKKNSAIQSSHSAGMINRYAGTGHGNGLIQSLTAAEGVLSAGGQGFSRPQEVGNLVNLIQVQRSKYATIIVSIIPILLVYPLVLKFYTKNITAGGVKE